MQNVVKSLRILPRWIILIIDLILLFLAVGLAYLLRFDFDIDLILREKFSQGVLLYLVSGLAAIFITKSYAGIIRFTSVEDGLRVIYMATITMLITLIINLIYLTFDVFIIPRAVIIIGFFNSVIFLFAYRMLVKYVFNFFTNTIQRRVNVLIFGAGRFGQITKQVIDNDATSNAKIVGFLDDDDRKVGKALGGIKIFNPRERLDRVIKKYDVHELIIASRDITLVRTNELVDLCLKYDIKVRHIPQPESWMSGDLNSNQIKELRIEDLLGRDPIKIDNVNVRNQLRNKRVLITGAAGSIGSEMVRQVLEYRPEALILLDQAETPLYEINKEIQKYRDRVKIHAIIGDVRDKNRLKYVFEKYKPEVVYHAAAYKHVPMMENNATEAVLSNVIGTKNLADISVDYNVKQFVMISTDKAVNPTNVMGASKRIAEIYVQSMSGYLYTEGIKDTSFITTRFGNVLGSNGSVIPLFKKQIEKGGPVTVTHPEMTRYFMTIPEACQLSLEAGVVGKGNEIMIIDMGKSIKIVDLAKKMIKLSGKTLDHDIDIVFTGLREGEKLYEELLNNKENTIPTHHPKIMIAKTREEDYLEVRKKLGELEKLAQQGLELEMVKLMKEIVPEFISNQSKFQELDKNTVKA